MLIIQEARQFAQVTIYAGRTQKQEAMPLVLVNRDASPPLSLFLVSLTKFKVFSYLFIKPHLALLVFFTVVLVSISLPYILLFPFFCLLLTKFVLLVLSLSLVPKGSDWNFPPCPAHLPCPALPRLIPPPASLTHHLPCLPVSRAIAASCKGSCMLYFIPVHPNHSQFCLLTGLGWVNFTNL